MDTYDVIDAILDFMHLVHNYCDGDCEAREKAIELYDVVSRHVTGERAKMLAEHRALLDVDRNQS